MYRFSRSAIISSPYSWARSSKMGRSALIRQFLFSTLFSAGLQTCGFYQSCSVNGIFGISRKNRDQLQLSPGQKSGAQIWRQMVLPIVIAGRGDCRNCPRYDRRQKKPATRITEWPETLDAAGKVFSLSVNCGDSLQIQAIDLWLEILTISMLGW